MENNESLKRGKCSLIFLSHSVPHVVLSILSTVLINVVKDGLLGLIDNWKLSGHVPNPFFIKCCIYCIWPDL